jgi:DNA repair exonuclease SbcCD ATPase subunit
VTEADAAENQVQDGSESEYSRPAVKRAPRLSREDVFAAADAILMAGEKVTIANVRDHLGRGSPNTIQEHLETWWKRLGSRLKDIPGREFPNIPEPVAEVLQGLWVTAVENAHAAIDRTIAQRDAALDGRELAIAARERKLLEETQATLAGSAALKEHLALAREQLAQANARAERFEKLLQARDADIERLRTRGDDLELQARELHGKLEAAAEAFQTERLRQDERHAANEARWLLEIDRGRQAAKETTKDHERQLRELRLQLSQVQGQRDELKRDLSETRADLRRTEAARTLAERRLAGVVLKAVKTARSAAAKTAKAGRPASEKRRQ